MTSDMDDITVKRRKVRKGTHSCHECRRRKVKCIYATPDNIVCIVCERRGTKCVSQCDSFGLSDAFDTVAQARAKAHTNVDARHLADDRKTHESDLTDIDEPKAPVECDPNLKLAAVSIPSTHRRTKGEAGHPHRIRADLTTIDPQSHANIREVLLHALPCRSDIVILSKRVSVVSAICYQSDYKFHNSGTGLTPEHPPFKSLLYPEIHPTLLARQMLLFAAAVQHLPSKEAVPALTEPHEAIMKRLADSAIKFVNMDDSVLGTLEGLENLIFEIFYHIDCGNIRRAWITSRRAVTAAQMLSLHRPGHHRFMRINDDSDLEPEVMWSTIVSMERMLSLLLGLPTSTGHMKLECQTITNDSAIGHNLSALVGSLSAKILERNQIESTERALDMTSEIDRQIILAAEQMPSGFWRPLAFAKLERDSWEALMETRRAFGHMCYFSVVVQLHLPHMLSPYDASQRVYSKIACANAGREILTRYVELRTFNPISACCRMSDFLALIAGMALMLGHITSHSKDERNHPLVHQRLGDRATAERALDCIDPASDLHEDVLAVRCATLLRDLLRIEADAARQHSLYVNQPQEAKHEHRRQHDILIMRVPYLGSIQISHEGVAAIPAEKIERTKGLAEGVTIGGIGSMLIGERPTSASSDEHDNTDVSMQPAEIISATYDPSKPRPTTHDVPRNPQDSTLQPDLVFPDATATFDDWVFQGVDTAFMESLMRGSAVSLSDDFVNESWDVSTFP